MVGEGKLWPDPGTEGDFGSHCGEALCTHLPAEFDQPGLANAHLPRDEGDELEITPDKLLNKTSGKSFNLVPLPETRQAIIDAGGLIPFTRQRLLLGEDRNLE